MGCGILFPRDYRAEAEIEQWWFCSQVLQRKWNDLIDVGDYADTDSDDGEMWDKQISETNIQVNFQTFFQQSFEFLFLLL